MNKFKTLSLLVGVILWQGSMGEPWEEQKHDFRIVYTEDVLPGVEQVVVERRLLNIDSQGIETDYWYQVGSGQEEVFKQAILDLAKKTVGKLK